MLQLLIDVKLYLSNKAITSEQLTIDPKSYVCYEFITFYMWESEYADFLRVSIMEN